MKQILIVLLLLALTACINVDASKKDDFIDEIVECEGYEKYLYKTEELYGNANYDDVTLVTFYVYEDGKNFEVNYLVWIDDNNNYDWEVVTGVRE